LSKNTNIAAWDFNGDGISDSGDRNLIHKFATSGNYTVNLTASNANGTDSKSAAKGIWGRNKFDRTKS